MTPGGSPLGLSGRRMGVALGGEGALKVSWASGRGLWVLLAEGTSFLLLLAAAAVEVLAAFPLSAGESSVAMTRVASYELGHEVVKTIGLKNVHVT